MPGDDGLTTYFPPPFMKAKHKRILFGGEPQKVEDLAAVTGGRPAKSFSGSKPRRKRGRR